MAASFAYGRARKEACGVTTPSPYSVGTLGGRRHAERTTVDPGWDDPAPGRPPSVPTEYGDGVVTPHASFLALPYAKDAAMDNLARIRTELGAYGPGGIYDSVAVRSRGRSRVRSGTVAERYLSLDQGMVMAAIGNELRNGAVQGYVVRGPIQRVIQPLLGIEEFNAFG